MKFGIEDRLVSSPNSCEFRKNWYRKGRPLHKGVMKLCRTLIFRPIELLLGRRSPVEVTHCFEFLIYVVRQESNETVAIFFYLTFTYKSTLSPSK